MADLSDAFLAIPGGWGTLEEIAEILTWKQLGLITQPRWRAQRKQVLRSTAHADEIHG